MRLLVHGGIVVDPANELEARLDLIIQDGVIGELGQPGAFAAVEAELIDASGCIVAPGLIDMHVHLREPGYEYKETV